MTYPTKKKNSTFVQNLFKNCLLVLFIYKKLFVFWDEQQNLDEHTVFARADYAQYSHKYMYVHPQNSE